MKLRDIRIEIKNEKQIKRFIFVCLLTIFANWLFCMIGYLSGLTISRILNVVIYILFLLPSYIAYERWGKNKEKIKLKNYRQYIWGVGLVPVLIACLFVADKYSGGKLIAVSGEVIGEVLWTLFFFFVVVAPIEEFIFRIYVQDELSNLLGKMKIISPFIQAVFFGWIHTIVGMPYQAYHTFLIGLVLGYAKYFSKDCTFVSTVMAHGLYNLVVTWFI